MSLQFPNQTIAAHDFKQGGKGMYEEIQDYHLESKVRKEEIKNKEELERAYNVLSGGEDVDTRNWLKKSADKSQGVGFESMDQEKALSVLAKLDPTNYDRIIKRTRELEKYEAGKTTKAEERMDKFAVDTLDIIEELNSIPEADRGAVAKPHLESLANKYPDMKDEIAKFDADGDGVLSDAELDKAKNSLRAYQKKKEDPNIGSVSPDDFTLASIEKYKVSGDLGDLERIDKEDESNISKVSPKDFTAKSIAKYEKSGNFNDLVRYEKPDKSKLLTDEEFKQKVKLYKATHKGDTSKTPSAPTKQDIESVGALVLGDNELNKVSNSKELIFAIASRAEEIAADKKIGSYDATRKAISELRKKVETGEEKEGWFGWDWLGGKDDPSVFDPDMSDLEQRFNSDESMKDYTFGEVVDGRYKVMNKSGKQVGWYE